MNKTLTTKSAGKTNFAAQLRVAEAAFAKQTAEAKSLRKQLAAAQAELKALKSESFRMELARKDWQIITLQSQVDIALRFAGLRPSKAVLDIDPVGSAFSPADAFSKALEDGDRAGAAKIFAAHKHELFAERRKN